MKSRAPRWTVASSREIAPPRYGEGAAVKNDRLEALGHYFRLPAFVIGIVATLGMGSTLLSTEARLFLATGVCGGYTTLSSLVYELAKFVEDGELMHASVYFAATFVGAVIAFYLGTLLTTLILRPQM
jgi:hypothetical protein